VSEMTYWLTLCVYYKVLFKIFFFVLYSTLLQIPHSDSTMSEDAGIELRTVATVALLGSLML
jgi:hypothetical protein